MKKRNLLMLSILALTIINIQPAHAYAGPGVAIGAIIVFITVVVTFFASFFITIFKYVKSFAKSIIRLIKNQKNIKSLEKKNDSKNQK